MKTLKFEEWPSNEGRGSNKENFIYLDTIFKNVNITFIYNILLEASPGSKYAWVCQ